MQCTSIFVVFTDLVKVKFDTEHSHQHLECGERLFEVLSCSLDWVPLLSFINWYFLGQKWNDVVCLRIGVDLLKNDCQMFNKRNFALDSIDIMSIDRHFQPVYFFKTISIMLDLSVDYENSRFEHKCPAVLVNVSTQY